MTYKPFDLTGKVALVTGGNGGIGLGMAEAMAASGADVAIWGTNEEKNAKAAEALIDGVEATVAELGRIDTVVANAGIGFGSPSFVDMTTEVYRKVLAVNLDGVFWTLRESARHMVERSKDGDKGGSLVGIASLAAIEGAARNQAYAATKGGVISMIKACASEYGRYNIRANAILPGWIATDMTSQAQAAPAFAEKVIPRVPIRRWGEPEDFGGMAVYLASDASTYTTGTTMIIDGGYSMF